jgi:hypothetical protein
MRAKLAEDRAKRYQTEPSPQQSSSTTTTTTASNMSPQRTLGWETQFRSPQPHSESPLTASNYEDADDPDVWERDAGW